MKDVTSMPEEKPLNQISHFRTNVLLKSIIGKDLINDDSIAVIELVKNSIDAKSPKIFVEFRNLKSKNDNFIHVGNDKDLSGTSKIIISDSGKGMDWEDIDNKWLNIAYSEKRGMQEEDGQFSAGSKGVGRFSCDRLGEYLDLYSRKRNNPIQHVYIRWSDFEGENDGGKEIQDVEIFHEEMSEQAFFKKTGRIQFECGTILEISKLRNDWASFQFRTRDWNFEKIIKLRKDLEKLINPYQGNSENTFEIYLCANELLSEDELLTENNKKINGKIKNRIFDTLDFRTTSIESKISQDGSEIITELKDKGRVIFLLREKNTKFLNLKNIKIVLFYLNQYAKVYFRRQTGVRSVDFGSVYLFRNGFRVPPFGDAGNDWLGLEVRKGQGHARNLGTRDLIGRIEITDYNNDFQVISSREGIVKNNYYNELVGGSYNEQTGSGENYFVEVFKKLEKYVVGGLDWDRVSKKKKDEDEDFGELTDSEVKKFIKAYEAKVMDNKDWKYDPEEEMYGETQTEKDRRVIELLYSILNVKPENILELYINEDLIKTLATEKEEKVKKVFQDFHKIDPQLVNSSTSKVIKEVNLLFESKEKEIDTISKQIADEIETSKRLEDELNKAKVEKFRAEQKAKEEERARKEAERLEQKAKKEKERAQKKAEEEKKEREKAQKKAEEERKEKERAQKKAEEERKEKERAQKKAEEEKKEKEKAQEEANNANNKIKNLESQNFFLKNSKSQSKDQLISYLHQIGTYSQALEGHIRSTLRQINKEKNIDPDTIIQRLGEISFVNTQIYTISNVGSKGGITEEFKNHEIDVISFIYEYLVNICKPYTREINIHVFERPDKAFLKTFKPFHLSSIIDNFISNSIKANAKNIYFSVSSEDNSLVLDIEDDGEGIPEEVADISSIFEPGVRYSRNPGTGYGLYHTKNIIEEIGGHISVEKRVARGIKFKVVIRK